MAEVIAAAKARLNATPFCDSALYRERYDHLNFLLNMEKGKL